MIFLVQWYVNYLGFFVQTINERTRSIRENARAELSLMRDRLALAEQQMEAKQVCCACWVILFYFILKFPFWQHFCERTQFILLSNYFFIFRHSNALVLNAARQRIETKRAHRFVGRASLGGGRHCRIANGAGAKQGDPQGKGFVGAKFVQQN
jgi:hypothetical protein